SSSVITNWLGPATGGDPITNNVYANINQSGVTSVACPPGTTTFKWGYNGSVYYFMTYSQNLQAGMLTITNSNISTTPVTINAGAHTNFISLTGNWTNG